MTVAITVGDVPAECEFGDSPTARRILEVLPIQAKGSYWGGEFYFPIPVKAPLEKDAQEVVEPGTVAYWPQGACLCVFWGPTPASQGQECRAAERGEPGRPRPEPRSPAAMESARRPGGLAALS